MNSHTGDQPKKKGLVTDMTNPLNLLNIYWCRGTESNCRHGDFQSPPPSFLTSLNYYNRLKSLIIIFQRFFRFFPILADFGKFFSHRFSHRNYCENDSANQHISSIFVQTALFIFLSAPTWTRCIPT